MHSAVWIVLLYGSYIITVTAVAQLPIVEKLLPEGNLDDPEQVVKDIVGFKLTCKASPSKVKITWHFTPIGKDQSVLIDESKMIGSAMFETNNTAGTLLIREPSPKSSDGSYQCFVENSYGRSFSRKLRVAVTYHGDFTKENSYKNPETQQITIQDEDVTVGAPKVLNVPTQITKYYGKSYGAVYKWGNVELRSDDSKAFTHLFPESENVALTANGDLVFLYFKKENLFDKKNKSMVVRCQASGGSRVYLSKGFKLVSKGEETAMYIPKFVPNGQPAKTEQALQDKQKSLHCITVARPAPTTEWFRIMNGVREKIEDRKNGYRFNYKSNFGRTLYIGQVSKEQHECQYQCVVTNNKGFVQSHVSQLYVLVPPNWTTKTAKKVAIPMNGGMELIVQAIGTPTPTYTWYANGTQIPASNADPVVRNNKLVFKNAKLYIHSGVYQAVAENPYGMVVSTTIVSIDARPPNIQNFGPFYLFKNTKGVLVCDSNAAPQAEHEWLKNNNVLTTKGPNTDRYTQDKEGSLVIKKVEQKDEGSYTCKAWNDLDKSEATAKATVYERTKITTFTPEKDTELIPKIVQDFRCQAVADPRLATILEIKWLKDGSLLKYSDNIKWIANQNVLQIKEPTVDDGALYTCVAYTDDKLRYSEDRRSCAANLIGVPYPPSNLTITNCYNLTTTIKWKPGSVKAGDDPITHYVIEQESEFEPDVWYHLRKVEDPSLTSIKIDLTPWAMLRFRMRAVNKVGPSRRSFPTGMGLCKTMMGRPSQPRSLRGEPKKANELDIAWEPLTKLRQNAPDCYYVLNFRKVSSKETKWIPVKIEDPKTGKYAVPNAGYYELWEFYIYANNMLGNGPSSDIVRSRSGQNAPTGKPLNVKKGAVTARTIELSWDRVTVDRGSVDGYIAYHWGKSLMVADDNGDKTVKSRRRREIPIGAKTYKLNATNDARQSGVVRGLPPYSSMSLVLKAFNSGGEGPESEEITFQTNEDVPGEVSDFDVTPFAKYTFVAWGPPTESNGVLLGYAIAIAKHIKGDPDPPINTVNFKELETNTQEHLFSDLENQTNYIVYLKARTKIGYGPLIKARVKTVALSKPATPRAPDVVGHSTTEVNVTFWFGKSAGGYPTEFKVRYKDKASTDDYLETGWFNHLEKRWAIIGDLGQGLHEFFTIGRNEFGESGPSSTTDGRTLPFVNKGQRVTPVHESTWFIVMLVLIALLLLFVVIVVLYRRRGGAKYPVGQREKERAGMMDQSPLDDEDGMEMTRPSDNPPPYHSDGSTGKRSNSDDDRDSLDDYGEGPEFKEDGSFTEEYGDDKKKLTDDKDKSATATFV